MSPLPVKGCKFWPMLGTLAIEQWGYFSVPHLLWHEASVYNGHLRGPVALALIAERIAVEPSYLFLRLRSAGIRTPILNLSLAGRNCHGIGIFWNWSLRHDSYYCWMLFYESPLIELIFSGKIIYFTNSNCTKVCVTVEFFSPHKWAYMGIRIYQRITKQDFWY